MTPSLGAPFRGFRDDSESSFFCAAGHTPEETWDIISIDRMAHLLVDLGPLARRGGIEMSTRLLCSWHREIFGELFPQDAGRLRSFREGQWEHVYFGVHKRGYRGTTPRELRRRLDKICAEFNTAAAGIRESAGSDSFSAIHAVTRLYAKVLRAHPWVDGNLRATTVALNVGLVMFDLDILTFKDFERHNELLGIAFVGKHDPYRPLAQHIAEIIRDSEST